MAWISFKRDLEKTYQKIDSIAKKGRDNYQEYNNYVDNLIQNGRYGVLTQVLLIKYDFDYSKFLSVSDVKNYSWPKIMFKTQSSLQDGVQRLLKEKSLYRIGLDVYLERPVPFAKVIDPNNLGIDSDLKLIIADDNNKGVLRIDVIKPGRNYSTASYVQVFGGDPSANATPTIRGGSILKVDVGLSGSNHGFDIKLGTIKEVDQYVKPIDRLSYTDNVFQQNSDNKSTFLIVDKVGLTVSASFSNWNFELSYDRNLLNLYDQAFEYLL
jgi:hypothetical protein